MSELEDVVRELKELNDTQKKLLEIQGLAFALEPARYVARKLRSGEALPFIGFWYQLVAGGATVIITHAAPEGYVIVLITEGLRVSQNGVFEFTRFIDDGITPQVYIPRVVSFDFSWGDIIPFSAVIKDRTNNIITNHDAVPQWVAGGFIDIFLRKDVWEKDIKLMDTAAEKYIYLAPPPMQR